MPRAASAPITTASTVASAAVRSDVAMAPSGSTPRLTPGRSSGSPSVRQAVNDHPVEPRSERTTSATSGAPATIAVPIAVAATSKR